jgi:hypothetical protein
VTLFEFFTAAARARIIAANLRHAAALLVVIDRRQ